MKDGWTLTLLASFISSLVVGIILMVLKAKQDASVSVHNQAETLRLQAITNRVDDIQADVKSMKLRQERQDEKLNSIDKSLAVMVSEQGHLARGLAELKGAVRGSQQGPSEAEDYGKVVRKP